MTDKEILKKAIERAEKNGFKIKFFNDIETILDIKSYYYLIFNHEFAKAFFTRDKHYHKEHAFARTVTMEHWEYSLQVMVLEKSPLQYLKKFLDND